MESRTSEVRSKLTVVVAVLALVVATLAYLQGGGTQAHAGTSFDQRVMDAINSLRKVVASSARLCTQAVNQTSADVCSVVPENSLFGSDLQKDTLASREIGLLALSELGSAFPAAYGEYSATHTSGGVSNYWLGYGTGYDNPGGATQTANWDQMATAPFVFDDCTVVAGGGTVLPCLKAPAAGNYEISLTTTFAGSSLGTRNLALIIWKDDGTGARDFYTAGGNDSFISGIPASELPTSEGGTQRVTLTENVSLAKGEKFSVYMYGHSSESMTSVTSIAAVMR